MVRHFMGKLGILHIVLTCLSYSKLIGGNSPGSRMFQALRIVKVAKLKSTDGRDSSATPNGNKASFRGEFSRRGTMAIKSMNLIPSKQTFPFVAVTNYSSMR